MLKGRRKGEIHVKLEGGYRIVRWWYNNCFCCLHLVERRLRLAKLSPEVVVASWHPSVL